MAATIALSPALHGVYENAEIQSFSPDAANAVLDKNHNSFHIFFNDQGFHNHLTHGLMTAYSLGASPEKLQQAFSEHADYQRPLPPLDEDNVSKMEDVDSLRSLFGKPAHFLDFRTFFERKIEANGWQNVVNEYLLSKTPVADDLLVRIFASIIHPLIHFGFGVEFQQPAIVAESLAEAAVHQDGFAEYLLDSEKRAEAAGGKPGKSLAQLILEIEKDPQLKDPQHWGGGGSADDTVLSRAPERLIELASEWRVGPGELEKRTAEMMNVNAWITGGAQRPPRKVKLDFFLIHHLNGAIFQSAFNQQSWMSQEAKVRLLEWKGRMDLINYASHLAPKLLIDEITKYEPLEKNMTWASIIQRVLKIPTDDGHIAKIVRSLAHAEKISAPFEHSGGDAFPIKGDMWLQIGNMTVDSTENTSLGLIDDVGHVTTSRWVRGAGAPEAWEGVDFRSAKL